MIILPGIDKSDKNFLKGLMCVALIIGILSMVMAGISLIDQQGQAKEHKQGHLYGKWSHVPQEPYIYHKCSYCGWIEAKEIPIVKENNGR
jgi:hypothetical protein